MPKICLLACISFLLLSDATAQMKTYCNPMNLDYGYTPIPHFTRWGKHRTTADPDLVRFKNTYVLFSTNQWGYWWSEDLCNWHFISRKFLRPWNQTHDELCAPGVGIIGDTMIVFGSTYTSQFSIWGSTDPRKNEWFVLVDSFSIGGWDPSFFTDDDGKLYMYNGSSNRWPLYGVELDRKTFQAKGTRKELYFLESWRFGWQRFGEYMDNTFLDPFIEGAYMTKINGKYYLQYGAPGTEFSGYADGVAIGSSPLGHFENQSDPMCFKPGGFAKGSGHGSTFIDTYGNLWHCSTIALGVKNNFERRLGLWPAAIDSSGNMYTSTGLGDYPHYIANKQVRNPDSLFTGWMLLNYQKPVTVSSTWHAYAPNFACDEDIKTYWSAASSNAGEWIQSDLLQASTIHAIQINYADQDADALGKPNQPGHQYKVFISMDGKKWKLLIDKSHNTLEVPHDYVEMNPPVEARYVRLENIQVPNGKFAISGLRIFGYGKIQKPAAPGEFMVLRTPKDKRSAWLRWKPEDNANGYLIRYGTSPENLHVSFLVYQKNEYWLKTLDALKTYYFTIQSLNEAGPSMPFPTVKVD